MLKSYYPCQLSHTLALKLNIVQIHQRVQEPAEKMPHSPRGILTYGAPPPPPPTVLSQTSLTVFLKVCQVGYRLFPRKLWGCTKSTRKGTVFHTDRRRLSAVENHLN